MSYRRAFPFPRRLARLPYAAPPYDGRVMKIAVCGAGVVGGGVVQLLERQRELLRSQRIDFQVKTIVCRDPQKKRDFDIPDGATVTSSIDAVLNDNEIEIIVEVIGGDSGIARDLVFRAADAGKHVVTANKALLAAELPTLKRLFNSRRARLGYEAAVCGGVPIIRTMQSALIPDTVSRVVGILNGTSNYILSAMAAPDTSFSNSYDDVLKRAQLAGFAEADPSGDVGGSDARNKLVLLTHLAFGTWVPPERVRTEGITHVSAFDMRVAGAAGYTIKLVGVAEQFGAEATAAAGGSVYSDDDDKQRQLLDVCVGPALVRKGSPLAQTDGAHNLVHVDSECLGRTTYAGAGAGRDPTALSIVADLVSIARNTGSRKPFPRPTLVRVGRLPVRLSDTMRRDYFVRGPPAVMHLLSLVLWRQGSGVAPCAGAAADGEEEAAAFIASNVSRRELESLIRRAVRRVLAVDGRAATPEEEAEAAESTVCWPLLDG